MNLRAYIFHKHAEFYIDCQDYYGIDTCNNRIAISDGMSQSIYPQWWAKILVNSYLETGTAPIEIEKYQKIWQEKVHKEIKRRESLGKDPWRLRNSIAEKSGAGATLCGLTWSKDQWRCECLGDSCLIAVTKDYDIRFYTSQVGEFGNHPDYYDSYDKGKGHAKSFSGDFNNLETLLLVTDPFSELFQKHETEPDFIKARVNEILILSDHKSFVNLVENWRNKFDMHNDDSTLIVLNEFENHIVEIIHEDKLEQLRQQEQEGKLNAQYAPIPIKESNPAQTQQENLPVNSSLPTERIDKVSNLKQAFTDWLHLYNGRLSDSKIKKSFWALVYPIVNDFIKMNKHK